MGKKSFEDVKIVAQDGDPAIRSECGHSDL